MKHIEDKVFLVTGSTDGIGKHTALSLTKMGAGVLLHGRNPEKCEEVKEQIEKWTGNKKLRYYVADYSSLSNVRQLAEEINEKEKKLNVLINNAGIGSGRLSDKQRPLSEDGYELRFAVNYLAPFMLTNLLLPLLHTSAPSKIINVASIGQKPVDFGNLMLERGYDPFDAYKQSKLALIMFTFELAKQLDPGKITANCIHPGSLLNTKMVRESISIGFGSPKSGAEAIVHLAMLDQVTGRYFDKKTEASVDPQGYDNAARKQLWRVSEELTGTYSPN